MSLILGVHLARKLYLVSDTRVTIQRPSGLYETRDDLLKIFYLSKRISAVVAGQVSLASFILSQLKDRISDTSYSPELSSIIERHLEDIVRDYVNRVGRVNEIATFIFAGYNGQVTKSIESSRLGDALSGELGASGRTGPTPQTVDPVIAEGLRKGIEQHGGLTRGQYVEVQLPGSDMFTLRVATEQHRISIERSQIECYDYAVSHPNQQFASVAVPIDVVSRLEFPLEGTGSFQGVDVKGIVYRDAEILTTFVFRVVHEQGFGGTVGGHIFVALQTDGEGFAFPAGELGEVREGRIVPVGAIFVKDGAICYRFPDGREGAYRMLKLPDELATLDIM